MYMRARPAPDLDAFGVWGSRSTSGTFLVREAAPEWDEEAPGREPAPESERAPEPEAAPESEAASEAESTSDTPTDSESELAPGTPTDPESDAAPGTPTGPEGGAERPSETSPLSAETEGARILELLVQAGLRPEAARVFLTIEPPVQLSAAWAAVLPEQKEAPLTAEQSDAVEELTEAVRGFSAQIAAGEYRLMILVAAFDRAGLWRREGHRSCADWLSWQTGMDAGAAAQRVKTAHALVKLPAVGRAMASGTLSYSKARALGRMADLLPTEEAQETWVETAQKLPAHELERKVSWARQLVQRSEAEIEEHRLRSRKLSIFPDEGGMYRIHGRLTADVAQLLMKALEAAGDVLFHADGRDWSARGDGRSVHIETITPEQRRADAIWLLAHRIMEVGFLTEEEFERELEALEVERAAELEDEEPEVERSAEREVLRSGCAGGGGDGSEDEGGAKEAGIGAHPAGGRVPRAKKWAAKTTW